MAAAEQFRVGLGLRPQDFWLNFYEGLCAYKLERFDESATAFRVCIAISPESAECFYNRALALGALGQPEKALDDYTRALELNPALGAAALNRGMLQYRAGRLAEATTDLNRALAKAPGPKDRGIIRYNLALVDLARVNRDAALANLAEAAGLGNQAALDLLGRLRAGD